MSALGAVPDIQKRVPPPGGFFLLLPPPLEIAVVLDLINPSLALRGLIRQGGKLRLDEANAGHYAALPFSASCAAPGFLLWERSARLCPAGDMVVTRIKPGTPSPA